ncbi:hypothetical protein OEZ85_011536 [Tetradesmus obliquus]|uniref:GCN5-related N-acetyltransferase Rv2170-like domain-containing protein n=1 Tax=Tetradesmus obliquus TaxID=3088 RepID=A0ABY8TRC4_TETOB|nr:hypothetical protein OEZ85_011536 [Tetradesmus obliquus]
MTTAAFTGFSDIQLFKAQVQPLLRENIESNTVLLSELHGLDHRTPGTFMGTCSCTECNRTAAVFIPDCSETGNLFGSQNSSARIVLVYTPEQHRRRGHARVAVAQLCSQLSRRYSHICLMASQANATANRAYQDVGFVTVGEICILKNAADGPAAAAPG